MDYQPQNQTRTVAVVGTGMAGLVTAYLLHRDPHRQYQVQLWERVSSALVLCISDGID